MHAHAVDPQLMNGVQQPVYTVPSHAASLLAKKAQVVSPSYTHRVMVLGWLKKEDEQ